jgi:hypothetical protein
MSQRECAGFNWPPLCIPAQEPVSISPKAVNRAGSVLMNPMCACEAKPMFTLRPLGCFPAIVVSGCGRFPPIPSDAAGVFQPARFACLGNWSNLAEPSARGLMSAPESFQSLVVGVVQPASCAADWMFIPPSRPDVPAPVVLFAVGVGQLAKFAVPGRNQVAQPLGCVRVNLVVVGGFHCPASK